MVRKSLFLILALAGFVSADTGFPSTIKVTETDNSPSCIAGQIKFGAGQVACSGQTATVTIAVGSGGSSSLEVISGVNRSSPTATIRLNENDFNSSVTGTTFYFALNPNATNYIHNQSSLQTATFNVSSGTALTFNASTTTANYSYIRDLREPTDSFTWPGGISYPLVIESSSTATNTSILFSHNNSFANEHGKVGVISETLDRSAGSRALYFGSVGSSFGGIQGAFYYTYPTNWANSVPIKGTMTVDGSMTASQNVTANYLRVTSTGTIGGVGICLENGTACPPSSAGGPTLVTTQTWSGQNNWTTTAQSTFTYGLAVGSLTVSGTGLLSVTQNGLTGLIINSTDTTPTVGMLPIYTTSATIASSPIRGPALLAIDSNGVVISSNPSYSGTGGGGGIGTVNAGNQFSPLYYSLSGSSNVVSAYPNVSFSTVTGVTFSTSTTLVSSITLRDIGNLNFNSGVGILNAQGVQTSTLQITGLTSKSCIGTDGSGNVQAGTCGGGGWASSLAVTVGVNRSSPTSDVMFNPSQFYGDISGSSITIKLTGNLSLSSFTATQPVLYDNTNGAFSLTKVSLSTGVVGTLPVGNGGTGLTSAQSATQPILYNSGTGVFSATPISLSTGVTGTLGVTNGGTGLTAAQSAVQPALYNSGTGVISLTPISLSTSVVGTLGVANGGTGLTSAQSATQPILYNSGTGVISATLISATTGMMGTLQAAQFPTLTGDLSGSAGSLSVSVVDDSHNHTGTTLSAIVGNTITTQIPSSVLPSTVVYTNNPQTISGHKTFSSSQTYSGSQYVSSTTILSNGPGSNGQVYTSAGPGATPSWTTVSGGGYATVQDEGSGLTQRTTLNFTGTGVSCADNSGSSRTDCTINSGAATAGGNSGNVQFNQGGSIVGASGFNVWDSSITLSTGTYKVYSSTFQIDGGSLSVNSGNIALNNVSSATLNAQIDFQKEITVAGGNHGYNDQILQSSGSAVAPKWGPIVALVRSTSTFTSAATTTPSDIPNMEYDLIANATYQFTCNIVFQTTATVLGARLSQSLTAGSTISATIEIPMAADGTGGALQGWVTTSGDSVTGTAVQAANTNYIGNIKGAIFVGSSGATTCPQVGGEVTNGSTKAMAGSICIYTGYLP